MTIQPGNIVTEKFRLIFVLTPNFLRWVEIVEKNVTHSIRIVIHSSFLKHMYHIHAICSIEAMLENVKKVEKF